MTSCLLMGGFVSACKNITVSNGASDGGVASVAAKTGSGAYVALGDSYTAAPLLTDEIVNPAGCMRSDEDYPAILAKELHPSSFVNATCYGASTFDMAHPQKTIAGTNPPQLNTVSAADSLVTVQVGGDDIGFTHIIVTCGELSVTEPFGAPCEKHFTVDGPDQLEAEIAAAAPKVAAVLQDIRKRAPHARILLIGYPDILPTTGNGCWPLVPFARGDVPFLRGVEAQLNAMLAAVAGRAGATYVDTYDGTVGHDACESGRVRWVEGLVPTSLAAPMHPNAAGERAVAGIIAKVLQ